MEIEMFFAKYDADGDGEFSYEEGQKLVEDLDNDMIDLDAPMVGNLEKTADTRALMGPATINHEEFGMWDTLFLVLFIHLGTPSIQTIEN